MASHAHEPSEALEACPFCGSAAFVTEEASWFVVCYRCGAEGPGGGRSKAEGAMAWNTRAAAQVREREAWQDIARPESEWHEDMGDVVWWFFPMTEAPWIGSPLSLGHTVELHTQDSPEPRMAARCTIGGWPGYHTHFTPLPKRPAPPLAETHGEGGDA